MMQFWTNFAKNGKPGISTDGIEWQRYNGAIDAPSNYLVLDKKRFLKMHSDDFSFKSLIQNLYKENSLTELEKCVVLFQMLTYVGDDLYDQYANKYPGDCSRSSSEKFLKANAGFIDY